MFNELHPLYKAIDRVHTGIWYGTRKGKPIADLLKEEKRYLEESRADLLSNEATPESPAFFEVLFVLCHSRLIRRRYSKPRGNLSYFEVGGFSIYLQEYFPKELNFLLKHLYQQLIVEGVLPSLTISSLLVSEHEKLAREIILARLAKQLEVERAERKVYYEKRKEKILECNKKYQEKSKEELKEYQEKSKEELKEYRKAYYEKNKEKRKEYNKKYQEKNKEKLREYKKTYREKQKQAKLNQ